MRHLAALLLASALVSMSCAHTPPIVNDVVTCGGHTVQPADVTEAYTDLTTQNWLDLAQEGVRLGWDVVACVIDDLVTSHPALKPAGEKFKSDHSEQIRKAQAPSVSLRGSSLQKISQPVGEASTFRPGGEVPSGLGDSSNAPPPAAPSVSTGVTAGGSAAVGKLGSRDPAGGKFTYAGETVSHAQVSCQAKCGRPDAIGSPGSGCLCWRGPRDARGGWVAIR
jgi:hypothetical protein